MVILNAIENATSFNHVPLMPECIMEELKAMPGR